MIALLSVRPRQRQRLNSVVGLALDGARLEGVWLRRTNGSMRIEKAFAALLTLDPLTAEPELVGREIRNHLDAAGIRERDCVVGLPLKWALTAQAELPELTEADRASFLTLEAERNFPCDAATLHICHSLYQAGGKQHALLVGIPRTHLLGLEKALRAARLKPCSFGLAAAWTAGSTAGDLALFIGESTVALRLVAGGGIAALRSLEGTLVSEGSRQRLESGIVARELRITLGQLPADLRQAVHTVRIFGPRELAQQLADELELLLESRGLKFEVVARYSGSEFGLHLPPDTAVSPALNLAAERLAGRPAVFEFLPPHVTAWQRLTSHQALGKYRLVGAAAAAALLLAGGAFGYQQWQLTRLSREWSAMAPRVKELELVQQQIKQYRPWFDESLRSLSVLRQLTLAFPDDGVVSAKAVEIRDGQRVTCTGVARENSALLKTWDRMRTNPAVSDLKVEQIRGKAPMQFTFNFQWTPGGRGEN